MAGFEFSTSTRIIFGSGVIQQLPILAADTGCHKVLAVTGMGSTNPEQYLEKFSELGLETIPFRVSGEPTVETARRGCELGREENCDLVLGLGGGSALDTAKAIAALIPNPGDILDYLEVIGKGKPLGASPLPWIAVPTTAGTGSEVTRNAVLASTEHNVKVSIRSVSMLARVALIDPELTLHLPPAITAASGMDALSQVIEPFVSIRANPLTDGFCTQAIENASWALREAFLDGTRIKAREAMCLVSLMGGLALANAGLGAVHGFAGPIGGMFSAPHGAVCAALLSAVMKANISALRLEDPHHLGLQRYAWIAETVTGSIGATPEEGAEWVDSLRQDLGIPGLSAYGIRSTHLPSIIEGAISSSSMKANPIQLSREALTTILEESL
jgi:alcohol dehydrogenase class IV